MCNNCQMEKMERIETDMEFGFTSGACGYDLTRTVSRTQSRVRALKLWSCKGWIVKDPRSPKIQKCCNHTPAWLTDYLSRHVFLGGSGQFSRRVYGLEF